MIREAFQSIQEDLQRSLFYWLTFVLTTLLIFVFFQIACSPMIGMTFINSQNNIVTYLSVFVLVICLLSVFFANDFYVKKKANDLAVRLVCGATFVQLAVFLLSQTVILFILAIPFAMVISVIILWLLPFTVPLTQEGFWVMITMLLCEIFWCTILNLGYAYRSSIVMLMQGDRAQKTTRIALPFHFHISTKKRLSLIMFIGPLVFIYIYGDVPSSFILFSMVGMIGMRQCLRQILIPYIDDYIQEHLENPYQLAYLGFLRRDIIYMENYIVFLITSVILMIGLFVMGLDDTVYQALIYMTYVAMNCLLSLTILFRFATETVGRQKLFLTLMRIGYQKHDLYKMIQKEITLFYSIILGLNLFYMLHIFISLLIHQFMNIYMVMLLSIGVCIPLLLCGFINYWQYKKQMEM